VLIHLVSSSEELFKVVETDGESDGETDGGPEGVSSTYPIPELEHVGFRDSEGGDGGGVGGEGDEVFGDVGFLFFGVLEGVWERRGVGGWKERRGESVRGREIEREGERGGRKTKKGGTRRDTEGERRVYERP